MAGILMESYLMAYGYAKLLDASDEAAHLFARNFDAPVSVKDIKANWENYMKGN